MAKEEAKTSPAYIDYEGEASKNEPATQWRHSDIVNYWVSLHRTHQVPVKWGLKETTLLSKLMKIYQVADIADMMQLYTEQFPHKPFSYFYTKAEQVFEDVKKEREEWQWET